MKNLFHIILDVIEVNQDHNVAQTINRKIADRLSILKLFFEEKNELIIKLRIYLYVLDYFVNEYNLFQSALDVKGECDDVNDKERIKSELVDLKDEICKYEDKLDSIKNQLGKFNISSNVLKNHGWRFKVEGNEIKDKYSYKELYQILFSSAGELLPQMYQVYHQISMAFYQVIWAKV